MKTAINATELSRLYDSGLTYVQLAAHFKCGYMTIYRHLKKGTVTLKGKGWRSGKKDTNNKGDKE